MHVHWGANTYSLFYYCHHKLAVKNFKEPIYTSTFESCSYCIWCHHLVISIVGNWAHERHKYYIVLSLYRPMRILSKLYVDVVNLIRSITARLYSVSYTFQHFIIIYQFTYSKMMYRIEYLKFQWKRQAPHFWESNIYFNNDVWHISDKLICNAYRMYNSCRPYQCLQYCSNKSERFFFFRILIN